MTIEMRIEEKNKKNGKRELNDSNPNGTERDEPEIRKVPRHKYCSIGIRHSNNGFVCTKNYKNRQKFRVFLNE